jgi:methyl coenzyme M reductase subunit D
MRIYITLEDRDTIQSVVEEVSRIAKVTGKSISFDFNGFSVTVGPNHTVEAVVTDYVKRFSTYRVED